MSLAPTLAAIDGGKSGLRLIVVDPSGTIQSTGPGFSYQAGRDDVEAILATVRQALDAVSGPVRADRLCAGFTGAPSEAGQRDRLRTALGALFGCGWVSLTGDAVLAHAGALAGPGVVICAGTGTIALALAGDSRHVRVDGWGPLIGDRGSGYAVGCAGLRAAAAALDGTGPATSLVDALRESLGGVEIADAQRFYRSSGAVAQVADFARYVAAVAHDGDEVGLGIWRATALDLADTTVAAAEKAGLSGEEARASWAGKLFHVDTLLLDPLRTQLKHRGIALVPPTADALAGGLYLAASGRNSPYGGLLDESGQSGGFGSNGRSTASGTGHDADR